MDAKVGDWVVTPRIGKPVEINALWYNALVALATFARRLGRPARPWEEAAERVKAGFERFWNNDRSEEHTSELQSQSNLVCRLLLEKKKKQRTSVDGRT